jgi:hypothetical protein
MGLFFELNTVTNLQSLFDPLDEDVTVCGKPIYSQYCTVSSEKQFLFVNGTTKHEGTYNRNTLGA